MTQLGVRVPREPPRLEGRSPQDYAQELQEYLRDLGSLASVLNTLLSTLDIEAGGGTVEVSGLGSGGIGDVFLLMGA